MNIYQKMSAVIDELGVVAKNLEVDTGKGKSYKAVSERDILDTVKPLEVKHGIYSYPVNREVIESNLLESETKYGVKTTLVTRIKTTYRFVNADEPTDFIEMVTFAEGLDSQDKGSGKAMTYADKYALMKAYKISTGDDPDQTASEETRYTRSSTKPAAPKKVSQTDVEYIKMLCQSTGTDEATMLAYYNVKSFEEMDRATYEKAKEIVEKRVK